MNQKKLTVQEWVQIETIFNNGIIKLKNNTYIKLIKIYPINFNLKSDFEKETILNSYKIFLKTCNFNFQILIQSNKQDLQKNINNINENIKKEKFLNEIGKDYINYIIEINSIKNSSSKDFYIIISSKREENNLEDLIFEELNEKYYKIKECLLKCGNSVKNISHHKEVEKISNFKSTPVGYKYQVSFTIFVDGNMTTFKSHEIANKLEKEIEKKIEEVYLCVIHVDPIKKD